ncbi:MAG: hypothetical protein METHAR1v1_640001, partial [Methanothrix sp.]
MIKPVGLSPRVISDERYVARRMYFDEEKPNRGIKKKKKGCRRVRLQCWHDQGSLAGGA